MTDLLIRLYLDEDVDVLVAELLRTRGFEATTVRDEGRRKKSDSEQLAYASSQGWAILTHNRVDFEELAKEYYTAGQAHYGIIIAVRRSPYETTRRLLLILNYLTADEMQDQIIYI